MCQIEKDENERQQQDNVDKMSKFGTVNEANEYAERNQMKE